MALANAFDAQVILIEVVDTVKQIMTLVSSSDTVLVYDRVQMATDIVTSEKIKAKKSLQYVQTTLEAAGVHNISSHIVEGEAARKIVGFSKLHNCGVIVMSTHGRSGLKRMFLGSVADYVIRHATCPVILVPPNAKAN